MIHYQQFGGNGGYAWFSVSDTETNAAVQQFVHDADHEAVKAIDHAQRRQVSSLARGLLRYLYQLLSTNSDTESLQIEKRSRGRPYIKTDGQAVHTSIAHSRDIVAVALDWQYPVGIDVEYCYERRNWRQIANRIFPADIAARIDSHACFYQAWCFYEAWGKANDLAQIDSTGNASLMKMLREWLSGRTTEDEQNRKIIFFEPASRYTGCVYRQKNGGINVGDNSAL